jgi:hypothetical protein
MRLENGEINMAVAGPMVERLALAMTGWFRESGAENYVEMNLNARDNSDDRYCVTVQKVWAKSPHQLRAEAEAARDDALARVERLEKALEAIERMISSRAKVFGVAISDGAVLAEARAALSSPAPTEEG